ncbi:MAG: SIMPL domain-containing protein [Solirubrobacteraceae bacterium]
MWKLGGFVLAGGATLALAGPALAATGQQISVNGSGGATVPAGATYGQQQTAYDDALTAAISDAQTKAGMVAQQLSLTLGPVQTFTEQSIDYLGYCGVGILPGVAATGVSGAPTAAGSTTTGQLKPIPAKPKTKKHTSKTHTTKKLAHTAQAGDNTCQIEADVTITYSAT